MEKAVQSDKKLKQKYICNIDGPILFTAPHSKKLYRGGKLYNQNRRIHLRQLYTSYLAVNFALNTGKYFSENPNAPSKAGSFCIWGKSSVISEEDLDPNYLIPELYAQSPFHQSLHRFQLGNSGKPLFHVDIHGKYDRKENCELDIGMACLDQFWPNEEEFIHKLKYFFLTAYNKLFKGMKVGSFEPKCNVEPYLSGLWGGKLATMTEQAVRLGIPSVQLQIPSKMRKLLGKDAKFRDDFFNVLLQAYKTVIIPWYSSKKYPYAVSQKLGLLVIDCKYSRKETEDLLQQLKTMEDKAVLDVNSKLI